MIDPAYYVTSGRIIVRSSDEIPVAVITGRPMKLAESEELARHIVQLLNHNDTVSDATNDLIHVLGNFLGIVSESRQAQERGKLRFMTDDQIGRFAIEREPTLRAALDNLRHARNVAKIEGEEQ